MKVFKILHIYSGKYENSRKFKIKNDIFNVACDDGHSNHIFNLLTAGVLNRNALLSSLKPYKLRA